MARKLEDILRNGWGIWRKNLILSVPFILSFVLTAVVVIIFGIVLMFLPLTMLASGMVGLGRIGMMDIILLVAAVVGLILLTGLISSFFSAGAIGMAGKAVEQKKPNLDDMVDYGRRKFINLFLASLIIILMTSGLLILLMGIFIGIPLAIGVLQSNSMLSILLVIIWALISLLALIVLGLSLTIVPYAIVISDLGAVEGVKKGVEFFLNNKLHVFLLWLIITVLSIAALLIFNVIQFIVGLLPLIGIILSIIISLVSLAFSLVVMAPLSTVWYSYLYLDRTK